MVELPFLPSQTPNLRIEGSANFRGNKGDQGGKMLVMKNADATRLKMEGNSVDGYATLGIREMQYGSDDTPQSQGFTDSSSDQTTGPAAAQLPIQRSRKYTRAWPKPPLGRTRL